MQQTISKGDTVKIEGKLALVESVGTFCVSGEVSGYYVLWLKKDGTVGKRWAWVLPHLVEKS